MCAQSKSVAPSKQKRNVNTGGDTPVKEKHNHKRKVVLENTLNVDERQETSATPQVENEAAKAAVIDLVSDDDLSGEWEDYPKPDPLSSRGKEGHSKRVIDRKRGSGAKAKRRGTSSSTKLRLPKGKRQDRKKRASQGNDSTYLGSGSGR